MTEFRSPITAPRLGSHTFRADYGIKYAYLAGAMYKGIASKDLVIALGRSGLLGYLGAGGLSLADIERDLRSVQSSLTEGQPYGVNLLCNLRHPAIEDRTVDLLLERGVRYAEAAAFAAPTASVVRYRLKGLTRCADGTIRAANRVLAKVSRPGVALAFMQPAPEAMVRSLVETKRISLDEANLARFVPVACEVCVEGDSGGHTDRRATFAILPLVRALAESTAVRHGFANRIHVGAAGGIGTPDAAAAAFTLGADFVLTGSVNQCTVEAGASDAVKDMLQDMGVDDTSYAPAGDMFELGAKVQVLKKGTLFAPRANKLHDVFTRFESIDAIDAETKERIQRGIFGRSFDEVWQDIRRHYWATNPATLAELEAHPKRRMAAILKWYFRHSTLLALAGDETKKIDFQIHCGPALGAFNQWVQGTQLESWRNRYVADIGDRIMRGAADILNQRYSELTSQPG